MIRRLQTGDKMAGRQGIQGVVSKITQIVDMRYLGDGSPAVDVRRK